ncbi:MAG: protein kinase [Polyangiaceae bacterium]
MQAFVNEGDVLAGKYRVERILGRGGMGIVVAAVHVQLGQRVALKLLRPELLEHPSALLRFMREARAAAQIQSDHVVRVMDVGSLDTGVPYMVMEFLQGYDLAAILKARGPLGIDEAVDYVLQAGQAVAEAHTLGIVHRDLKPANLFLTRRGNGQPLVKVLDFGISKANFEYFGEGANSVTMTHAFMGSPLYMAPEQLRDSKDVDARADVWSLGVVLYELLSGSTPYYSETPWDLIASIIAEPPPAISSRRPDVPPAVDAVLVKCLQRERDQRYQSLEEFMGALARSLRPTPGPVDERAPSSLAASARIVVAPPKPNPAMHSSIPAALTSSAFDRSSEAAPRRRAPLWLAAAAGALLLVGGAFWLRSALSSAPVVVSVDGSPSASVEPALSAAVAALQPEPVVEPLPSPAPAPSAVAAPEPSVSPPVALAPTPKPARPAVTRAAAPTARSAQASSATSLDKFLSQRKPGKP